MRNQKNIIRRKRLTTIGLVFFIALFLFSGYMFLTEYMDRQQSTKDFEDLAELVSEADEGEQISAYERYLPLYEQNNDFAAWIHIDGTVIDYPVMYHPSGVDYYLKRNFEKQSSSYGVPYIKEECVLGVSDNCTIYGHHMKNGTMFSDLMKYEDPAFFQEHGIICLDTLEEYGRYQIVVVFKTVAYSDAAFNYQDYIYFDTPEVFDKYISTCRSLQLYDTGVDVQYGDKLITLSTCEYSRKDGRMVVVAKKLPADALQ